MMAIAALGVGLAGLAGVLLAPISRVHPAMGAEILTAAFVVVVIGGLGSFWGVVAAALLVGVVRGLTVLFLPAGERSLDVPADGAGAAVPPARPVRRAHPEVRVNTMRKEHHAAACRRRLRWSCCRSRCLPSAYADDRDRRGDLRHRLHGTEHPGRVTPASCRSAMARSSASPPMRRRSRSATGFPATSCSRCCSRLRFVMRSPVLVGLPDPAAARRLFLAADARAHRDAVRDRVPLDRVTGGENGLGGVTRPLVLGVDLDDHWIYYWRGRDDRPRWLRIRCGASIARRSARCWSRSARTSNARASSATRPIATSCSPSWSRPRVTASPACSRVFNHRFASADPISRGVLRRAAGDGGDRRHAQLPRARARRAVLHPVPRIPLDLDAELAALLRPAVRRLHRVLADRSGRRGASALLAPLPQGRVEAAAMAGRAIAQDAPLPAVPAAASARRHRCSIAQRAGQELRRHPRRRGCDHRRARPHAACADRPERRRQDHGVQSPLRHVSARPRLHRCSPASTIAGFRPRPSRAPASAARSRSPICFPAFGRGEHAAGRAGAAPRPLRLVGVGRAHRRGQRARPPRSCAISASPASSSAEAGVALLWRPAPARHGARARDRAAHPAARRAARRARGGRAHARRRAGQEHLGRHSRCCWSSTTSTACSRSPMSSP